MLQTQVRMARNYPHLFEEMFSGERGIIKQRRIQNFPSRASLLYALMIVQLIEPTLQSGDEWLQSV
jgi:hypothetical protein